MTTRYALQDRFSQSYIEGFVGCAVSSLYLTKNGAGKIILADADLHDALFARMIIIDSEILQLFYNIDNKCTMDMEDMRYRFRLVSLDERILPVIEAVISGQSDELPIGAIEMGAELNNTHSSVCKLVRIMSELDHHHWRNTMRSPMFSRSPISTNKNLPATLEEPNHVQLDKPFESALVISQQPLEERIRENNRSPTQAWYPKQVSLSGEQPGGSALERAVFDAQAFLETPDFRQKPQAIAEWDGMLEPFFTSDYGDEEEFEQDSDSDSDSGQNLAEGQTILGRETLVVTQPSDLEQSVSIPNSDFNDVPIPKRRKVDTSRAAASRPGESYEDNIIPKKRARAPYARNQGPDKNIIPRGRLAQPTKAFWDEIQGLLPSAAAKQQYRELIESRRLRVANRPDAEKAIFHAELEVFVKEYNVVKQHDRYVTLRRSGNNTKFHMPDVEEED